MKKLISLLLSMAMILSLNLAIYANEKNINSIEIRNTCPHDVNDWYLQNQHYEAPSDLSGSCSILVKEYQGLCIRCYSYIGKFERTQLKHSFTSSGRCKYDCGIWQVR